MDSYFLRHHEYEHTANFINHIIFQYLLTFQITRQSLYNFCFTEKGSRRQGKEMARDPIKFLSQISCIIEVLSDAIFE